MEGRTTSAYIRTYGLEAADSVVNEALAISLYDRLFLGPLMQQLQQEPC